MLRFKMNNLIRLLERNDTAAFNAAIQSKSYMKALNALEDAGCVKTTRSYSGDVRHVKLLNHSVAYQLSRQEVWLNRLWGFTAGVASALLVAYLTGLLRI